MDIKTRLLRLEKQLENAPGYDISVLYQDGKKSKIHGSEGIALALKDRGQIDSFEEIGSECWMLCNLLNAVLLIKKAGETDELQI